MSIDSCGNKDCRGYCWAYDNDGDKNEEEEDIYTDGTDTRNRIGQVFCKCCGAGYGTDGSGIIPHPGDDRPTCTGRPGEPGRVGIVWIKS